MPELVAARGLAGRIHVDHGLTGTNRERPGLREALAACRAGQIIVAAFESYLIRLRTVEGMKVAKAKGRLRGKQPKLSRKQKAHLVSLVHNGEYSTVEVAELFSAGRSTVYRAIERQRIAARAGIAEASSRRRLARADVSARPVGGGERRLEVGDEVVDRFKADGEADETVVAERLCKRLGCALGVLLVRDEGFVVA